ncbi:hypothetical protein KY5_6412 [Streptomyces formicae]|uniref:Uncharacterized protein n=1 Tax=Streptomyces formicae TaxID=1616117 RepID=A0A291QHZ6_9ACTN|nr:hypothetical protein KY5_6412 [Streptomyces formicae]
MTGLTITDRTLKAWLKGRRGPSRKNLEHVDAASWSSAP